MGTDSKEFVKAYFRIFFLLLILVGVMGLMIFSIHHEKKCFEEKVRIESEYSWFIDQSVKIIKLSDYISVLEIDDRKYSGARERLDSLVTEYNLKAVLFTSRSEWNCVAPYQYSVIELLYRGAHGNENIREELL